MQDVDMDVRKNDFSLLDESFDGISDEVLAKFKDVIMGEDLEEFIVFEDKFVGMNVKGKYELVTIGVEDA